MARRIGSSSSLKLESRVVPPFCGEKWYQRRILIPISPRVYINGLMLTSAGVVM